MTTNLPAQINTLSDEELMKITGQGQAKRPQLPRLKINRDAVDEHENTIPVGTFQISQGDDHSLFSKTAVFRPFINTFQYQIYDANEKKTTNRSIHIRSWGDEAIDELGGIRCGKIPNKKTAELSATELEKNKKIKCYRFVYGTVSMDGTDEKGQPGTVQQLPVKMKLSGSNFMPFGEAFDLINALKRPIFKFNMGLSLSRQKNGATTFYIMAVQPDVKNILEVGQPEAELMQTFTDMINRENDYITTKYREAKKTVTPPWEGESVIKSLSDDLDDGQPITL